MQEKRVQLTATGSFSYVDLGRGGTKQLEYGVSLYGVGLMTVDLRLEYTVRTCELEAEHGCY